MSMYSKFSRSISMYYNSLQDQYSAKYVREAMIGMVILVCLGGGFFLNKFYIQYREEKAFVALSEVVDSFTHAQRVSQTLDHEKDKDKINQAWHNTEVLIDALYQEHVSSYLAPYFLVFKSQIVLDRDRDLEKSMTLLDDALNRIPKNSEMGSVFHLKRIKMGFDSKRDEEKEKSLRHLIQLTENVDGYVFEEASYLLGAYYLSLGESEKAQEIFKKIVDKVDDKALIKSPWVILAQEKLGIPSIVVENE